MALPLVSIVGKVLLPDGTAVAGAVAADLSFPGSVSDGTHTQQVATRALGTIAADGTLTLSLVPNDVISPANTTYLVTFYLGTRTWQETWTVASTPNPVDVGSVSRVVVTSPPTALGPPGVVAATLPVTYNAATQTVGFAQAPVFDASPSTALITGGVSARSLAAHFGDRPTPFDFGAIGDGLTHPLSTRYGTLGAAQAVYPFATALTQEIDWAAIQAAINWWPIGGLTGLPPAKYKTSTGLTLLKTSSLIGSNWSSRDGISGAADQTVIDATALGSGFAIQGPSNGVGCAYQGFRLKGGNAATGIYVGGFITGSRIRDVNVTGFATGIGGDGAQDLILEGVWTDVQTSIGLDLNGATDVTILGSMFANTNIANVRIRGGSSSILYLSPLQDEAFSAGAASILLLDCDRVEIIGTRVFYAHGGYGIRLGDGTNNPTNVTLRDTRIERFSASTAPIAGLEIRGSGHVLSNVRVDVSADGGTSAISDLATDTVWENVTEIGSGFSRVGRWKYPTTDASGTPGNATINKATGTVAIATGQSAVAVTNSLVTAASIVTAVLQTADANNPVIKSVVAAAGSFTVTVSTAVAAATKVAFTVQN